MKFKLPILPISIEIKRISKKALSKISNRTYNKIFVIGFNKTGTTTIKKVLYDFGFKIGNQPIAEILGLEWGKTGNYQKIINYCHSADAFQDSPFSRPTLYEKLDLAFPNSKFILTVRDDENEWFNSLVRFHTMLWSSNKNFPPTPEDLEQAIYRYKGMPLDSKKIFFKYPDVALYDKQYYIKNYLQHNKDVENYFFNRPNDLIKVNVSHQEDFNRIVEFLNVETNLNKFPHLNKTI
ncbi:sulfotransferase [Lunatibacter salilacus]|uniref:sulfotransferase n=1 Tax=Lunatibacter salilacus TaxID=2483804 RepID=UPI00131C62B6|nr:sulfotransferase [Lunatibacter salilacus]